MRAHTKCLSCSSRINIPPRGALSVAGCCATWPSTTSPYIITVLGNLTCQHKRKLINKQERKMVRPCFDRMRADSGLCQLFRRKQTSFGDLDFINRSNVEQQFQLPISSDAHDGKEIINQHSEKEDSQEFNISKHVIWRTRISKKNAETNNS